MGKQLFLPPDAQSATCACKARRSSAGAELGRTCLGFLGFGVRVGVLGVGFAVWGLGGVFGFGVLGVVAGLGVLGLRVWGH